MRERRWRRENLFNPYIVLADVTIATIVIFVVLLISSETKGADIQQELQSKEAELKTHQERDRKREELEHKVREKSQALVPTFQAKADQWRQDKIYVSWASGPNTFLIRVYGDGLWTGQAGNFSREGRINARTVVSAIQGKCKEYLQSRESPALIEIRVEGHCSENIASSSLEQSLERAKTVRGLFPEELRRYISVSGFGSDRPAYETTPATIAKRLKSEGYSKELTDRLSVLDTPTKSSDSADTDPQQWDEISNDPSVKKHLNCWKSAITDRIDIVLVYSGLLKDNNFVYPRIDDGDLPEWVNDVSTPWTDQRFLRPRQEDGAL